jgi:hypothetical protein
LRRSLSRELDCKGLWGILPRHPWIPWQWMRGVPQEGGELRQLLNGRFYTHDGSKSTWARCVVALAMWCSRSAATTDVACALEHLACTGMAFGLDRLHRASAPLECELPRTYQPKNFKYSKFCGRLSTRRAGCQLMCRRRPCPLLRVSLAVFSLRGGAGAAI